MNSDEIKNPGLERVRLQLRSTGFPIKTPNPLRNGIHNRGYLPHVKREGATYFVTFRLADSLPRSVAQALWADKARRLRALHSIESSGPTCAELRDARHSAAIIERDYRRQFERYLDQGVGACHLRRPDIATLVKDALVYAHGRQYLLDDWVIMPNHVHLILWPMPSFTLSEILKSRKQYTSMHANRILQRTGEAFWQAESYDHWIRDDAEKSRIQRYIRTNPVTAGLCMNPEDWPWGSAAITQGVTERGHNE